MALTFKRQARIILDKTHEGADLKPADYVVVVRSIDTPPSSDERELIASIYEKVAAGLYPKHRYWFWGVEHLERRDGKLWWKDTPVAICNFPNPAAECAAATMIEKRCKYLEMIGVPVTVQTMDWNWPLFEGLPKTHPYRSLFALLPGIWERTNSETGDTELLFILERNGTWYTCQWSSMAQVRTPLDIADPLKISRMGWTLILSQETGWRTLSRRLSALNVPPDLLD